MLVTYYLCYDLPTGNISSQPRALIQCYTIYGTLRIIA